MNRRCPLFALCSSVTMLSIRCAVQLLEELQEIVSNESSDIYMLKAYGMLIASIVKIMN